MFPGKEEKTAHPQPSGWRPQSGMRSCHQKLGEKINNYLNI
jgi:hypothetical protein